MRLDREMISFRVRQEDAQILAREFYPLFVEEDLVNLSNYHIYLKLMIDGKTSRAFSAVTLPPPEKKKSHKKEFTLRSKESYGRPRHILENRVPLPRGRVDNDSQLSFFP